LQATDLRGKQQTLEATRQRLVTVTDSSIRAELQKQEQQQRAEYERATAQATPSKAALYREDPPES